MAMFSKIHENITSALSISVNYYFARNQLTN